MEFQTRFVSALLILIIGWPEFGLTAYLKSGNGQHRAIQPALIVHGGAGDITDDRVAAKFDGMKAAVRVGYQILEDTDSPIDAVEKAVNVLENLYAFNAGHGAVQTATGDIEMDALIINGTDLTAGAVGAVRNVANPISLARRVMEKTEHVFIAGDAAREFAIEEGIPLVPTRCLKVPTVARENDEVHPRPHDTTSKYGTVGAVAINSKGQIAVATSTGGMSRKMNGRIGDTPIIGGGTLADDNLGGVSGTGWGEAFMRTRIASRIVELMEKGLSPTEAGNEALAHMASIIDGADGGVIVISPSGEVGYAWNSNRMAWAFTNTTSADANQFVYFGIDHGVVLGEPFSTNSTYPIDPPACPPL